MKASLRSSRRETGILWESGFHNTLLLTGTVLVSRAESSRRVIHKRLHQSWVHTSKSSQSGMHHKDMATHHWCGELLGSRSLSPDWKNISTFQNSVWFPEVILFYVLVFCSRCQFCNIWSCCEYWEEAYCTKVCNVQNHCVTEVVLNQKGTYWYLRILHLYWSLEKCKVNLRKYLSKYNQSVF